MDEQKLHKQIMDDALKDPEPKPTIWIRYFLLCLGIIIIFAFLIAFLGGGQSILFIESRLHTSTVSSSYTLFLDDGREIILTKEVFLELQNLMTMDSKEFKACLLGKKQGNNYNVSGIYVPSIYSRDYESVTSEMCDELTIISLHSHPVESCEASDQDMKSFKIFRQSNPDALYGIMCGFNRFIFYG